MRGTTIALTFRHLPPARKLRCAMAALALVMLATQNQCHAELTHESDRVPNIIVIMADDKQQVGPASW